MIKNLLAYSIVFVVALSFVSNSRAHDVFQDVLKEVYMLKSFSCKTCHPDGDDRTIRTPFADRIHEQMKDQNLAEKFATAVALDEAAKVKDPESVGKDKGAVAEFEKMVAKDFKVAFKVVAQQKMSIDDIIKQGLFNGARLDTKAIEAAKSAEDK